jgi:hypothetical protein
MGGKSQDVLPSPALNGIADLKGCLDHTESIPLEGKAIIGTAVYAARALAVPSKSGSVSTEGRGRRPITQDRSRHDAVSGNR